MRIFSTYELTLFAAWIKGGVVQVQRLATMPQVAIEPATVLVTPATAKKIAGSQMTADELQSAAAVY